MSKIMYQNVEYGESGVTSVNGSTGAVNIKTINSQSLLGSGDLTINVPTKTSDLTNDSGFITGYTETDPVFSASAAHGITSSDIDSWDAKQDELVSGVSIRTINGTSVLGSGDISVAAGGTPIPTADTVAEFDSDAHMNSEDMTASEVSDFVDGLDVHGGETEVIPLTVSSLNHLSSVQTATLYKKGNVGVLYMNVINTSSNLAVGGDASFSVSGLPTLVCAAKGVGYSGNTALITNVGNTSVTMRVIGGAWIANYNCTISVTLVFE